MGVRALIFINPSGVVEVDRQMDACVLYASSTPDVELASVVRDGQVASAQEAIRNGEAQLVIAAYRDAELELTDEIQSVGGTVEYVQPPDRARLTVRGVIASLYRRLGWPAATIARVIGASTADVADHLRRSGIQPRK